MVDTEKVDHLKGEWLLAEVVWLAKSDIELDAPVGHSFLPWDNSLEQCLARAHLV
jgi:hypothetical protein